MNRGHRGDSASPHALHQLPSAPPPPRPIIDPPCPTDTEARSSSDPPPRRAAAPGAAGQKINVGVAFAQCSCKGECTSLARALRSPKACLSSACLLRPTTTQDAVTPTTKVLGSNKLRQSLLLCLSMHAVPRLCWDEFMPNLRLKVPHMFVCLRTGLERARPKDCRTTAFTAA